MDPDQERSAAEVRALADALVGASPAARRAELPRWCDELRALVARPPRARPDDFWDRVQGWNRLGDALGDLQKRVAELDDEIRKALLPICLEAMARHPGRCFHRLPLPVDPELIEPLVALLHASSAHVRPTSRATTAIRRTSSDSAGRPTRSSASSPTASRRTSSARSQR
jgi:hypothetical protein